MPVVIERYPHKPYIMEMRNVTVQEGESARFECRLFSDLSPYVAWFRHYEVNGSYVNATGSPYGDSVMVSDYQVCHSAF